jgi:predicted metalloprotease
MSERTLRQRHRLLLALIAAVLLSVALGYTGLSDFDEVAFAAEKASAEKASASTQKVLDELEKMPAASASDSQPEAWTSEEELVEFAFNDANDMWSKAFANSGDSYSYPNLWFVYDDPVQVEACGNEQDGKVFNPDLGGPFWCPTGDIYYTVNGDTRGHQYEAFGDFAVAYIMAHEVAHHVQWQLGYHDLGLYSIQVELQADCFAGVWANSTYHRNMLDTGDIEEAMLLATYIADPPGTPSDDPQAHGSAEQRQGWFMQGYNTGDPNQCQTW